MKAELASLIVLHVLGASVWVGGHLVLAWVVLPWAGGPGGLDLLRRFESRFEKIALPALAVQALTGLRLVTIYFPKFEGLLPPASAMAVWVWVKLGLLAATVALGLHARFRLIPGLTPERFPALRAHILSATLLAALMALAGVFLRLGGLG